MCAQSRSVEDYEAMRKNPAPLPYLQRALTIATFEPGVYEVVETYSGTASQSGSLITNVSVVAVATPK
jgi:hypothetical protein